MKNKTVGIIGAGNMGGAFYKTFKSTFPEKKIFIYDINIQKIDSIEKKDICDSENALIDQSDIIFIAVKPQVLPNLIANLDLARIQGKVIVSMLAGVSLERLQPQFQSQKIIRIMPNLAIQVKKGVTGWIAGEHITQSEKEEVKKILSATGVEIEMADEKLIDSITALSGSAIAYYFYFCELLSMIGEEKGFTKEQSSEIAATTFVGAALLLEEKGVLPQELKDAVTSKGGTTEAALNTFQSNDLKKVIHDSVAAAIHRAHELNSQ